MLRFMWGTGVKRSRADRSGSADPEPTEILAGAIESLRHQIPPLSPGLEERVLQSARRSREARGTRPGYRAPIALPAPLMALWSPLGARLAIAATALMLVAMLALGSARDSRTAIASGPLSEECPGATDVRSSSGAGNDPGSGRRAEQRVLQVAGTWTGQERVNFEKVLELFERTTDVEVSYAYQTREIAKTLRNRANARCPPDIALLPQPGLLQEFAEEGWLEPLDPKSEARVDRNYTAAWRERASLGNKPYGVWLKAANKSMFWYNRGLFAAANVKPPRTWQGLQRVAARLSEQGIAPFAVAGASGSAWTLTDWFENVYLRTAGKAKYDALARGDVKWTDSTVRRALLTLSEILSRSEWLAGGRRGAARTEYEQSVRQVFSQKPRAAMVFEGDFVAGLHPSHSTETVSYTGTFPFPAIERAHDAVIAGGDVAVRFKTKNASAASEFMHFLAGPAAAGPWASAGGFISPNKNLDPRVYKDSITRRLATTLIEAETTSFDLSDLQPPAFGAEAGQGMWRIFEQYLRDGPASVTMTMKRLEKAAEAARTCERFNVGQC